MSKPQFNMIKIKMKDHEDGSFLIEKGHSMVNIPCEALKGNVDLTHVGEDEVIVEEFSVTFSLAKNGNKVSYQKTRS